VAAGADDYQLAGDEWQLTTAAESLATVVDALDKAGIKAKSNSLAFVPKIKKPLAGRDAQVALNLVEALDDHDDVQNVYADFDISDEELAALEGAG
jgi:transcriptional/translational regulatory protein YebC/TACO1